MGPINHDWIAKNGAEWAAGRIDVSGTEEFWGTEIGVPPMHYEDWRRFSDWLWDFQTRKVYSLDELVEEFEVENPKITWFKNE